MLGGWKKSLENPEKKKPRGLGAEKKIVSRTGETEDELIIRIPRVRRLRPVVVEPDPVRIAFQVEQVRIAIGVGIVWYAVKATAEAIRLCWRHRTKGGRLYCMRDRKSTSVPYQVILFRDIRQILREKP